jgi:hypothetical protein
MSSREDGDNEVWVKMGVEWGTVTDRNPSPGPFAGSSCLAGMGSEQRCEEC